LVLLSVVSAQFACRKGSLAAWSATAVLFVLAMWCIPIAVYYVAGIVFWMTLAPFVVRSNESMLRADRRYFLNVAFAVVAAVLLTLILYSPILAVDGLSAVTGNQFVQPSPIGEVVAGLPELARATISDWTRDLPAPGGLVLFVGLAIAVWSWRSPKA